MPPSPGAGAGPPTAVVLVALAPTAPAAARIVAARTASEPKVVEAAATQAGTWSWGTATNREGALRLVAQARAAGLTPTLVATDVPTPTFLPALVAAGIAQVPTFVSTGDPTWDRAILAGFGITALLSLVRALRRIGPARRAARALGALAAWRRTPRTTGPEAALLRLEEVAARPDAPAALLPALDAAWAHWFATLGAEPPVRDAAEARLRRATAAVEGALGRGDTPALTRALAGLSG